MKREKPVNAFNYLKLWLLYGVCIIVVYFMPPVVKYPFFLALLLIGFFSKDSSFVLAFWVILFAEIGGLFPETARAEGVYQRLPVFGVGPVRMPLYDMSLLMLSIKAYISPKVKPPIKLSLKPVLGVIIVLFVFSVALGMGMNSYRTTIRALLSMLTFYFFPRLICSEKDLHKFFSLIFSAVFVIAFATITEALTGFRLGNLAGEVYKSALEFREIRLINSPWLLLISFIFASYWLYAKKKSNFREVYLSSILALCYILIILSATRGWFLAFSLMLSASFVLFLNKTHRTIAYLFPITILIIIVFSRSPQLSEVLTNVTGRLSTIGDLAEGDLSGGGRITVSMPRMLIKVRENPILGFGFSDEYYQYADNHAGWVMQILQMGVIGLFVFLALFYRFVSYNYSLVRISGERALHVFSIALMGLMVIHSTSTAVFAFSALGAQYEIMQLLAVLLTGHSVISSDVLRSSHICRKETE